MLIVVGRLSMLFNYIYNIEKILKIQKINSERLGKLILETRFCYVINFINIIIIYYHFIINQLNFSCFF